jgi:hypothetical protein
MNALAPLLGVLVLSVVLVINFFRAAWRLGILRAFGRRCHLRWRALAAGAAAACLPVAGALLALSLIPADNGIDLAGEAGFLAAQLALSGFFMHVLNDHLVVWGRAQARA